MAFPRPGGGGGPATFPVGPLDDGTNTYEISATTGELKAQTVTDTSGADAAASVIAGDPDEAQVFLVAHNGANDKSVQQTLNVTSSDPSEALTTVDGTDVLALTKASFAFNADDGTFAHAIATSESFLDIDSTVDGSNALARIEESLLDADTGVVTVTVQNNDSSKHATLTAAITGSGSPSSFEVNLDDVTALSFTPTTTTIGTDAMILGGTIPTSDPHVAGQVYSTAGALFISAG